MRAKLTILCAVLLGGCSQVPNACDVPVGECPGFSAPAWQCPAGATLHLYRPDVCSAHPSGGAYLGALYCGYDALPFQAASRMVEAWCQ